jgi:transposase
VSRRFEQALLAAGELVVRVAPHRMARSWKGERRPGKSDQIDALAIARAVAGDGIEKFPAAHLGERAMEIRLLCDHRGDLVADRTRTVNRFMTLSSARGDVGNRHRSVSPRLSAECGRQPLISPEGSDLV